MNHKQMPRLGSAIASTILSVFGAVSLVGVDKAQAAVLHYTFDLGPYSEVGGYLKFNNSSVTGIDFESVAVSEGRLDMNLTYSHFGIQEVREKSYNLAGAIAGFYQGDFLGLSASGSDYVRYEYILADEPGGPFYWEAQQFLSWEMFGNSFKQHSYTIYFS